MVGNGDERNLDRKWKCLVESSLNVKQAIIVWFLKAAVVGGDGARWIEVSFNVFTSPTLWIQTLGGGAAAACRPPWRSLLHSVTLTRGHRAQGWSPPPAVLHSRANFISSSLGHLCFSLISSYTAGQIRHLMAVSEWWITPQFSDWVIYRLQHYGLVPSQSGQHPSCLQLFPVKSLRKSNSREHFHD